MIGFVEIMKKKILFISMLSLLTVMPCAFAAEPEQALPDTPVAEEAPQLNLDNQTVKKEKKSLFSRTKKAKKQKKQTNKQQLTMFGE